MAGQDIKKLLAPGQSQPVQVGGDFIFMKTADRPITVIINGGESSGSRVTMTAGDKYRPGNFKSFEIENTDAENAAEIVITVGRGDYNRQTVTGQLTTRLGILTGSGEYIDDTRNTITLDAITVPGTGITETFGELILIAAEDQDFRRKLPSGVNATTVFGMTYNQKIHDGLILTTSTSGIDTWAWEIDPITKATIRDLGKVPRIGTVGAVCRYGGTLYQTNTAGTAIGIYKKLLNGSWERIKPAHQLRDLFCCLDDGNLIYQDSSGLSIIDQTGKTLANVTAPYPTEGMTQDNQGNIWVFPSVNAKPNIYDKNLNLIGQAEGNYSGEQGTGIFNEYFVTMGRIAQRTVSVHAKATVTDLLAGKSELACKNAWLAPRPKALNAARSGAEITVSNGETGSPTVSGQLVRLIMEWYLGQPVPENYMDYLHGLRITGNTDINGISYPPIDIKSNGQTLLAAKVPDNFTQVFPIRAQFIVDKRILEL